MKTEQILKKEKVTLEDLTRMTQEGFSEMKQELTEFKQEVNSRFNSL